jgi:hypothetical protein
MKRDQVFAVTVDIYYVLRHTIIDIDQVYIIELLMCATFMF